MTAAKVERVIRTRFESLNSKGELTARRFALVVAPTPLLITLQQLGEVVGSLDQAKGVNPDLTGARETKWKM